MRIGEGCCVDYGVMIASSGPPVVIGQGVTVLANAVIRSVGGHGRPGFPVRVGDESMIAPQVALLESGRGGGGPRGRRAGARELATRSRGPTSFGRAFALDQSDQEQLHRDASARLREEAAAWTDEPVADAGKLS